MRVLETGTDELLGRVEGHVAVLSFNRPQRRNALSEGIFEAIGRVLPTIAQDPEIRVLMLTGEGDAFCAGGDVKGMNERNVAGVATTLEERANAIRLLQDGASLALRRLPQPVVAALSGATAGAGLSIALAADLRIAAERALIVTAFANIATSGDFGTSWFLPHLVGEAKAKELMFTSPRLSAREAADLGIVNVVLADEGFADAALAWCADLAQRAPIALRMMKENINRAAQVSLEDALDAEAVAMALTMSTVDHREAAAAFVEKRPARFTGK